MVVVSLSEIYSDIAQIVWAAGDAGITLSESNLPQPPKNLETNALVIRKTNRFYNGSFRVDALDFFANKESYAHFGLLIMAAVFWPEPFRIQLNLTNSASDIRFIILEYCHAPEYPISGYHTRPHLFRYFPKAVDKYPWVDLNLARYEFPLFRLTNINDWLSQDEDWECRDTIIGLGGDRGSARFAELMLDTSRPDGEYDEIHLECDAGFCGINTCSAEAHIWLPGSFGWVDFETNT